MAAYNPVLAGAHGPGTFGCPGSLPLKISLPFASMILAFSDSVMYGEPFLRRRPIVVTVSPALITSFVQHQPFSCMAEPASHRHLTTLPPPSFTPSTPWECALLT